MTRTFRLRWADLLEYLPHLLGGIALSALGAFDREGAVTEAAPAWIRGLFWVTAAALFPICFLAGRQSQRGLRLWERQATTAFNGTFAVLSGVSVALLGVFSHFGEVVSWSGASSYAELIGGPLAIGGVLGALGFTVGYLCRRRSLL